VVDKRITPRFIRYERLDLWLGIVLVVMGGVAMMGFTAATFAGRPEFGHFADAGAVAAGMQKYFGRTPGVLFALALIDACIIGAAAVSLSTAYALGDVLSIRHSLHRKPADAPGFYALYFGLIVVAAALVLTPGTPLGLLTNMVQTLAGVLLPSATVFLLLLCNDKAVLGPWVNGRAVNVFTASIIAILVMLSVILTASVLFPAITDSQILGVLIGGSALGIGVTVAVRLCERASGVIAPAQERMPAEPRSQWRMPPLNQLPPARLTLMNRLWMGVLRAYLLIAASLLLMKLVQMAMAGHTGA